jgi:hypothetical protein
MNGMSDNAGNSTIEKFDPINMGVAAGILCLSALELEIHLEEILPPPWITNVSILYWTLGGLNGIFLPSPTIYKLVVRG